MSLAGHLESDPKGKGFPWKHSSDVRPQKRPSGQVRRRLLNKTPQQSQFCIPRGEKSTGGREVAKKWGQREEGTRDTHSLASASAMRA